MTRLQFVERIVQQVAFPGYKFHVAVIGDVVPVENAEGVGRSFVQHKVSLCHVVWVEYDEPDVIQVEISSAVNSHVVTSKFKKPVPPHIDDMSHFSVIVATKEHPNQDVLKAAMQPFHQFECTGIDDQYVIDVDETEETRTEYVNDKIDRYRDPDGGLHDPYENRFFREPTADELQQIGPLGGSGWSGRYFYTSKDWGDGKGYRPKIHFMPEGWEKIELPTKDVKTFSEYVQDYNGRETVFLGEEPDLEGRHKYGYCVVAGPAGWTDEEGREFQPDEIIRVVRRTNPNCKWDYWRVGGRFTGMLRAKESGACPSQTVSWEWKMDKRKPPTGYDICQKSNLDVPAMKQAAVARRQEWVDECCQQANLTPEELEQALHQRRQASVLWEKLPEPRPRGFDYFEWLGKQGFVLAAQTSKCWEIPELAEGQTLAQFVAQAPYLSAFAFLRDGRWFEKGRMGWWACVSDEQDDWPSTLQRLVDAVPEDWWLAVLDCHI